MKNILSHAKAQRRKGLFFRGFAALREVWI